MPTRVATDAAATISGPLWEAIGPLQRVLRKRAREDWPAEPLATAQVDMLRIVRMRPQISVGEAATELRIAPNTASTLAGQLAAAGLLVRETDARDRRCVRLALTQAAEERIGAWRDRRRQLLAGALEQLDDRELDALEAALPALRHLLGELER